MKTFLPAYLVGVTVTAIVYAMMASRSASNAVATSQTALDTAAAIIERQNQARAEDLDEYSRVVAELSQAQKEIERLKAAQAE